MPINEDERPVSLMAVLDVNAALDTGPFDIAETA